MEDITAKELNEKIDSGQEVRLIDVRELHERQEYNIGGEHMPLGFLIAKMDEFADWKDEEIVVYCRSGARSGLAKELMAQRGFEKVRNLTGGMIAWQAIAK